MTVRDLRAEVHRAQRRVAVQIQRVGFVYGSLQNAGGGGPLLEKAHGSWQRSGVWLAQGRIRPVLADRANRVLGTDIEQGRGEIATCHASHDEHGQT